MGLKRLEREHIVENKKKNWEESSWKEKIRTIICKRLANPDDAPVTPVERSPVMEVIVEEREELGSDSDSEYGFGDRWGGEANTSKAWGPLAKSSAKKNSQRRGKSRKKRVGVSTVRKGEEVPCQWFVANVSNWHWELFFKGPFMAPRYIVILNRLDYRNITVE